MSKKATKNLSLLNMFNNDIKTGVITLTFNRREIIEGYMLGVLPFERIVSKLDLHSGYSGLKVEISKKDGVIASGSEARITYIR